MYYDICAPNTTCKVVNLDFFGMNLTQSAGAAPKGFWNALPYFVLVGLVVITAFLQQRQTMRNQTQANPQMQIIGKVMPIIFGFISINLPAGVVLYFFTSNLWQIGQQEVVFRTIGTAAGPPAKKGDKGGGKGPDKGGGKGAADRRQELRGHAAVDGRGQGSVQELGAGIGHAGGRRPERQRQAATIRRGDRGQGLRLHPEEAEEPTGGNQEAEEPTGDAQAAGRRVGQRRTGRRQHLGAAPEQPKAEAIDGVGGDHRPDGRRSD